MKKSLLISLFISSIFCVSAQEMPKYYKNYLKYQKQLSKGKFDNVYSSARKKIKRATKDTTIFNSELALLEVAKAQGGDGQFMFFAKTDSILSKGFQLIQTDTSLTEPQKLDVAEHLHNLYLERGNYRLAEVYGKYNAVELADSANSLDSLEYFEAQLPVWEMYSTQGYFYRYNNQLDTLIKYLPTQIKDSIALSVTDSLTIFDKPNGKIKKRKSELLAHVLFLKGKTLFEQAYYKECERFLDENIKTIKKNTKKKDETYAKALRLTADVAKVNEQSRFARRHYKKAIKRYKKIYDKTAFPLLELEEQLVCNYVDAGKTMAVLNALETLSKHTFKRGKETNYYHIPHLRATAAAYDMFKEYDKAEELYQKLYDYQTDVLPYYHKTLMTSRRNTYQYLLSRNYFDWAEKLSEAQSKSALEAYGEGAPKASVALVQQADYLTNFSFDLVQANKYLFDKNWDNYATSYSSWHPDIIPAKINRSRLLAYGGKLEEATTELEEAKQRNEDRFGKENRTQAIILLNWSRVQLGIGNYDAARDTAELALELFKEISGKKSLDYLLATQVLADYHLAKGNLFEADQIYDEIVSGSKKLYQEIRLTQATDPESLAKLYLSIGDIDKAESMLKKTIKSKGDLFGYNHISGLKGNYLMADVQLTKGNLVKALQYAENAAKIGEDNFEGERRIAITPAKRILAEVQIAIGNFEGAHQALTDVFEIQKEVLGNKHIELARTSLLLSELNYVMEGENLKRHIKKMEKDVKSVKKASEEDFEVYAESLVTLAKYYQLNGDYNKAVDNTKEALEIIKEKEGKRSEKLAKYFALMADVYLSDGNFDMAELFHKKSASILSSTYHELHHKNLNESAFAIKIAWKKGDKDKAIKAQEKLVENYQEVVEEYLYHLNKKEQTIYQQQMSKAYNDFYAMALESSNAKSFYKPILESRWTQKSINVGKVAQLKQQISLSENDELISNFRSWKNMKSAQTQALVLSKEDRKVMGVVEGDIKSEIKDLEKFLRKNSPEFALYLKSNAPSYKDVVKHLPDTVVAIEMLRYVPIGQIDDSSSYVAIQLKKGAKEPVGVNIENGIGLENEHLVYYHNAQKLNAKDLTSYTNYWKPLETLIGSSDIVYISADGVYSVINPEPWQMNDSARVFENYDVRWLNSIGSLANYSVASSKPDSSDNVALYSLQQQAGVSPFDNAAITTNERVKMWYPLANKYCFDFSNAFLEEQTFATDTVSLLQIETYNFATPRLKTTPSVNVNPAYNKGVLSGIIAHGGGQLTQTKYPAMINAEQGVITSGELARYSFEGVDAVVLPDFETRYMAFNSIRYNKDIVNAMIDAGAENVIYTLNQVSSETKNTFLSKFYELWLNGNEPAVEALRLTKQSLIKSNPEKVNDWCSFVLIQ